MICYLVTSPFFFTTTTYYKTWGREFAPQVRLRFYEHLSRTTRLPAGTYIFSDIERLEPTQAEAAARLWADLDASDKPVRLLNHPTRSMRRYELLRTLYKHGLNRFNIYRLTELEQPRSFPVFIRGENDHKGNLTPLLYTQAQLDDAIADFDRAGRSRNDKVIVEFCDTSDAHGIFRKYSAFVVGDRIIPTHIFFTRGWMAKVAFAETDLTTELVCEERRFVEENPHEQALREIARLARIEYGRIDYALHDGQLQVWEINTNPTMPRLNYAETVRRPVLEHSTRNLNAALAAINCDVSPKTRISTSTYQSRLERLRAFALVQLPPHARVSFRRWHAFGFRLLRRAGASLSAR